MPLDPFVMVEMRGISIISAIWFMFLVVGGGVFVYWALREFGSVWKRLDKHDTEISMTSENAAVTRSIVERIERKLDLEERI